MSSPLRVVIAEDNYLVREGTRRLLEDSAEVDVVAAVGSADELIDAVERLRPQAVLTDIRMPPGRRTEGIEAIPPRAPGFLLMAPRDRADVSVSEGSQGTSRPP